MVSFVTPELYERLTGCKVTLVDNRIVIGKSTWAMEQPVTVCILHPKQNKAEHKELLRQLLSMINREIATLQVAPEVPQAAITISVDSPL